jgi:hypothetical protein
MIKKFLFGLTLIFLVCNVALAEMTVEAWNFTGGLSDETEVVGGIFTMKNVSLGQSLQGTQEVTGGSFGVSPGFISFQTGGFSGGSLTFSNHTVNGTNYIQDMEINQVLQQVSCQISPSNLINLNTNAAINVKTGLFNENVQPYYDSSTETLTYNFSSKFGYGRKLITIEAQNISGAWETTELSVSFKGAGTLNGDVLVNPVVFQPARGGILTFGYQLQQDVSIKIMIYSVDGRIVWNRTFAASSNGGTAGYNQVTWDGLLAGSSVGNGVYLYQVFSGNDFLYKGKIIVNN